MYFTIEEAKKELVKRNKDKDLVQRVEEYLGGQLPSGLPEDPPACLLRQVASCRFEDVAFSHLSESFGMKPYWASYLADRFTTANPDKVNYVMMKVKVTDNHSKRLKVVSDWEEIDQQKPKLGELRTKYCKRDGSAVLLPELHQSMRRLTLPVYADNVFDCSDWYNSQIKRTGQYYTALLALFVCHGIMFEDYHDGPNAASLANFVSRRVEPALHKVINEIGLAPLIVRFPYKEGYDLYPKAVLSAFDRF